MAHKYEPDTFEHDEALRAKRRKIIFPYVCVFGAVVALFWGALFVKLLGGYDAFTRLNDGKLVTTLNAIYVVLGFTAAAIFLAIWQIRGSLLLLEHGVEITGRVISVSVLRSHGMRPVRFDYEYEGVRYERTVDLRSEKAAKLKPGSPILLLVNSKKPSHAMPKCNVAF